MKESNRPGNISRRDTIRLLPMSATLVAGAVTAGAIPSAAWAAVSAPCGDAAHSGQRSADTTQDLAKLAAEHFEPLVGETFTIGDNEVTLRDVRHGPKTGSHFRQQFAVVFDAPHSCRSSPSRCRYHTRPLAGMTFWSARSLTAGRSKSAFLEQRNGSGLFIDRGEAIWLNS